MGKGGGGPSMAEQTAAQAQREQMKLARQLVNETAPLRAGLTSQLTDFLGGNGMESVYSSPQYQAMNATLDMQAQRAADNAISNMPEGGTLSSALTNIDMQKALGLAQGSGAIADANVNRALQLGTFGAAQGSQGFGTAGQIGAQMAQAQAQQNAGKSAGAGSAIGSALGYAALK